jgi:hypothetical protein
VQLFIAFSATCFWKRSNAYMVYRSLSLLMTAGGLAVLGSLTLYASPARAQVIFDRTTLNSIEVGGSSIETFETYTNGFGNATAPGAAMLNATASVNGNGHGLVIPGITISDSGNAQRNGDEYFGVHTTTVLGAAITITFAAEPPAVGIDLLEYGGYPDHFTPTALDAMNSTVSAHSGITVNGPSPVFFGYQHARGIGLANPSARHHSFSPIINSPTTGNGSRAAESKPGSIALLGSMGVLGTAIGFSRVRRRRSEAK